MATDFQFVGIPETLAAFESRGAELWALFAGKRMIIKGAGIDELKAFLDMVATSGTVAVYTLKIYEGLEDKGAIKSNSPDDGSFNFKLNSLVTDARGSMSGRGTSATDLELATLRQRVADLESDDDDDTDQGPGFMDQIGRALIGLLEEPNKLQQFFDALTNRPGGGGPPVVHGLPHRVGQVDRIGEKPNPTGATAEQLQAGAVRIGTAVETLGRYDAKIVEHLETLARMAQRDPGKFSTLLTLLDAGL